MLAGEPERLAARRDEPQVGAGGEELGERRGRFEELLEVVEHEQHPPVADVLGRRALSAEGGADRREDELGVVEGLQADPPDAVLVLVRDLGPGLHGEPRLARATRAGQRQQAHLRVGKEGEHFAELLLAADERRRLLGQVRLVERLERRELGVAELVEPLRCGQVLEPMLPEVK